jgi:GT2 family glycosyltransferase
MNQLTSITIPNLYLTQLESFFENNWQFLQSDINNNYLELIVVSSAVKRPKQASWQNKYPKVKYIFIEHNRGFTSTVNKGFEISSGEWIGTVNDDVVLSSNWISKLLSCTDKDTGSINPVIKDPDGNIESAGIKVLDIGKALPITQLPSKKLSQADATNAACVLYSAQALEDVGCFDERFGSYLEDVDLSLRLAKAGWQNVVCRDVIVVHQKHASSTGLGWRKNWLDAKNWWLVIIKNWTRVRWQDHFLGIILERLRNIFGIIKSI